MSAADGGYAWLGIIVVNPDGLTDAVLLYFVGWFIATGAMVQGPVVPIDVREVFPVRMFSVRAMVHETPEYLLLLRYPQLS